MAPGEHAGRGLSWMGARSALVRPSPTSHEQLLWRRRGASSVGELARHGLARINWFMRMVPGSAALAGRIDAWEVDDDGSATSWKRVPSR